MHFGLSPASVRGGPAVKPQSQRSAAPSSFILGSAFHLRDFEPANEFLSLVDERLFLKSNFLCSQVFYIRNWQVKPGVGVSSPKVKNK